MKGIAAALLLLLVLAAAGFAQVPDDKLIVPGQRIGKWTLAMTINDLLKMNGPRKGIVPHPDIGLSPWPYFASPTYEHLWVPRACFYALTHGRNSQKVVALGIPYPKRAYPASDPCTPGEAYRAAKGPLYTLDALEGAYGKALTLWVPGVRLHGGTLVIFDKIGLATWVFGTANLTGGFLVFRPGTAKTIWKF